MGGSALGETVEIIGEGVKKGCYAVVVLGVLGLGVIGYQGYKLAANKPDIEKNAKKIYTVNFNDDKYPDLIIRDKENKIHVYLGTESGDFVPLELERSKKRELEEKKLKELLEKYEK